MNFKIIGDSCTDPVEDLCREKEYSMVPLLIRVGGQELVDNGMLSTEELLARMAASAEGTGTACPAPRWYMDAFEGEEDVFVITLSAALSGSYNSAMQAKNMYLEEHPEKKIHVINSHSASAGQSAILIHLFELCRSGLSFEEIVPQMDSFIAHLTTLFVLENLDNLRKNGRLSEFQAILTSTLRIKLVMAGTPAGTIEKVGQALTINQALSKLADEAATRAKRYATEKRTVVISHCNCRDRALTMRNYLLKRAPFLKVVIVRTGGVSTVYAGDGGIVVAF